MTLLSTTIHFSALELNKILSLPTIRMLGQNQYQIYISFSDKAIAEINIFQDKLIVTYSSELLLEEYMLIHDVISQFTKQNKAVDDSNSFLGYLPNGEPAYIIRNWKPWLEYIQKSMKNCQ